LSFKEYLKVAIFNHQPKEEVYLMIFSCNADFGEMQMQRVLFCMSMQTKRLDVNKPSRTCFEQLQYAFQYQQCNKSAKICNQEKLGYA
jgi:hypothetical protein